MALEKLPDTAENQRLRAICLLGRGLPVQALALAETIDTTDPQPLTGILSRQPISPEPGVGRRGQTVLNSTLTDVEQILWDAGGTRDSVATGTASRSFRVRHKGSNSQLEAPAVAHYSLIYFDLAADRGEVARLAFTVGGVPFAGGGLVLRSPRLRVAKAAEPGQRGTRHRTSFRTCA